MGCEHLTTLRLHTYDGPVTIVITNAPNLTSTTEAKDEFYSIISNIINNIPSNEHVILLETSINACMSGC